MSSSKSPKVIMGSTGTSLDETSLEALRGGRSARAWDPNLEAEYWSRVRTKAEAMALDIVTKARAEAEVLKSQALQDGYTEGALRAQAELDASLERMGQAFGQALAGLKEQTSQAWASWRQDVVTLVRLAVDKTLSVEMEARRAEILGSLLDQALDLIDSRKELTILVSPQDEPLMAELMQRAQRGHPGLERWRIKASPDLAAGGLVLESDQGMVDNTLPGRFADVDQILLQLDLGEEVQGPGMG